MWIFLFATGLLNTLQGVEAYVAPNNNAFIVPPASGPSLNYVGNLNWSLGSVQEVQWTTTLTSYSMELWQQGINPGIGYSLGTIFTANGDGSGDKNFQWSVQTYSSNVTFSPIFFLWVNPNQQDGISSHYFNITEPPTSSASLTTRTESPTSATDTSMTPFSTTQASATPDTSTADIAPASHSNNSTIKVGLGVGLGVGIPLVLIAGIWIGITAIGQRRRSRRADELLVPLGGMSKDNSYLRYTEACPDYPQPSCRPDENKDHTRYRAPVELGSKTPAELG